MPFLFSVTPQSILTLPSSLRSKVSFNVQTPIWGGFSPRLVSPDWQWFWKDLIFAVPNLGRSNRSLTYLGSDPTVTGSPSVDSGVPGTGIRFNGTNENLKYDDLGLRTALTPNGDGNAAGPWTVLIHFKADANPSTGVSVIIRRNNFGAPLSGGAQFLFHWDHPTAANQQAWYVADQNSFEFVKHSTALVGGVDYVLMAVWDGTTLTIYKDGIPDGSVTPDSPPVDALIAKPVWLGSGADETETADSFWAGLLYNAMVWTRALSDAEIATVSRDPFGLFRMYDVITAANIGPAEVSGLPPVGAAFGNNNIALGELGFHL